jgi:hypothetical protein
LHVMLIVHAGCSFCAQSRDNRCPILMQRSVNDEIHVTEKNFKIGCFLTNCALTRWRVCLTFALA